MPLCACVRWLRPVVRVKSLMVSGYFGCHWKRWSRLLGNQVPRHRPRPSESATPPAARRYQYPLEGGGAGSGKTWAVGTVRMGAQARRYLWRRYRVVVRGPEGLPLSALKAGHQSEAQGIYEGLVEVSTRAAAGGSSAGRDDELETQRSRFHGRTGSCIFLFLFLFLCRLAQTRASSAATACSPGTCTLGLRRPGPVGPTGQDSAAAHWPATNS